MSINKLILGDNLEILKGMGSESVPIAIMVEISPQGDISSPQGGMPPCQIKGIEFIASGQSEAGIEFYSWDFNYKHNFNNIQIRSCRTTIKN